MITVKCPNCDCVIHVDETEKPQTTDEFAKLKRDLKDCRNELCLRCGGYREKHLGACDGCRWRDMG